MAPPHGGNYLRPHEEEWREVFNRLSERFPTVPGQRVAQALREHSGHAGEAAAVLRALTGSDVKEADPDDVEHVATLLSSPAMFKHACKEQFKKFDINKDGALEWNEVNSLVQNLYEEFGLQVPPEGALKAFFYATDENQDGVLSEREFRKFFEMFLRYAFFDHLKLKQMVEKGQAIEQQRLSLKGGIDPKAIAAIEKVRTSDAETTSPQDSRASSASDGSKPDKIKSPPDETQAIISPKSQSKLAPLDGSKHGRRSPSSGQERHREHRHREHRNRQDKDRDSVPPPDTSEGSLGTAMRCLAPHGVAYRATPAFQDRLEATVSKGDTVRVLEHWVRTPDGWLPVTDPQGQSLFDRCNADPDDCAPNGSNNQKKRVSIQEQKDDTLDANIRNPAHSPAPPRSKADGGGGGLQSNEEEWRPVFERLSERFPNISQDKIVQALRDNGGHAGKAASMLRYM